MSKIQSSQYTFLLLYCVYSTLKFKRAEFGFYLNHVHKHYTKFENNQLYILLYPIKLGKISIKIHIKPIRKGCATPQNIEPYFHSVFVLLVKGVITLFDKLISTITLSAANTDHIKRN